MALDVKPVRPSVGLRPVGDGEDSATSGSFLIRRREWLSVDPPVSAAALSRAERTRASVFQSNLIFLCRKLYEDGCYFALIKRGAM